MSAFDKIIGYESIKADMSRVCDVLKNSEKYESLGVTLPNGILLIGEPGIGKTLMAKCLIEETGCKSYTIRKDKPDGDFTNMIRETFEEARKETKSIVFLDDMDKFANEDERHPDAEEYVTVQACIDDTRDDGVFVIATINEKKDLPKSLLRTGRFDKIIEMRAPEFKDTIKLVKYFLEMRTVGGDVDAEEIAGIMTGKPISDIKAAINEAGINAGFEGRAKIARDDVLKAIKRLLFDAPECVTKDENDSQIVAVHEMGHVIVAEMLEPGSVSLVSIESHNGSIGGVTRIRTQKDVLNRQAMENQAIWTLGGRAATELFFGIPDVGSSEDIISAYNYIEKLICNESMSGFETFDYLTHYGGAITDHRHIRLAHEMERCYQKAKEIIASNRVLFETLLELLIKDETLTSKDIREVIDSFAAIPGEVGVDGILNAS